MTTERTERDLLEALKDIEREAQETLRKFNAGLVVNGRSAIQRMKFRAGDAVAEAEDKDQARG